MKSIHEGGKDIILIRSYAGIFCERFNIYKLKIFEDMFWNGFVRFGEGLISFGMFQQFQRRRLLNIY